MTKKYLFPIIVIILLALGAILGLSNREAKLFGYNSSSINKNTNAGDKSLAEYYQTAQSLQKGGNQSVQTTFLATGDIMLSRSVATAIKKANDPLLPFKHITDLLGQTDFNFGNLESPLTSNTYFGPSGQMVFNVPPGYADGLKKYNFQIVNLANNHAFDQGKNGLDYTRKFLDDNGIAHIGTGNNLDEAWQPSIITSKGIKIGFIGASFSSVNDGGKTKNNYVARIEDVNRLKLSIIDLKSKADFIVVTMHAGTEYTRTPNASQTAFAHAAIDAGADIIIGAHPHWVQTIEKYKDKYIFYSLGNFIFDQEWSQETKEGLVLKITLAGTPQTSTNLNAANIDQLQGTKTGVNIKQIELVPIILENFSQPRVANEAESTSILKKIGVSDKIITP